MTSNDTPGPIVLPPGPPPDGPHPPTRRFWWVLGAEVFVLGVFIAVTLMVSVPYVAFSPGSATPTESLILVEGAETFPSDGEVLFTTVHIDGVSGKLTIGDALYGWRDDTVTVVPRRAFLGDETAEENRQQNQQLMSRSTDIATLVALSYLGYDVPASGTGALITQVVAGTPADLVVEPGDTVVAVNGEPVSFSEELATHIGQFGPGDTVTLTVETPDGTPRTVETTLAERPDDPSVGFFGVRSQTRDLEYQLPFNVTIEAGNVGGPSAGLAFTLALLDLLTPGELTGGETVAVTGTISPDGEVGPVGGVQQKTAAAIRNDASVFLVPPAMYEVTLEAAEGSGLRVEQVATLEEALAALDSLGGNALALPRTGDQGA